MIKNDIVHLKIIKTQIHKNFDKTIAIKYFFKYY